MRHHADFVVLLGILGAVLAASCGGNVVVDHHGQGGGAGGEDPAGPTSSGSSSSSGGTGGAGGHPLGTTCPEVTEQPLFCLTVLGDGRLGALDPSTGAHCPLAGIQNDAFTPPSSLAVLGGDAYFCAIDVGLLQVTIATGAVVVAPLACEAVATWNGGLLVKAFGFEGSSQLEFYPTFQDALGGAPAQVIQTDDGNTRMTALGDTLFTAWHSTSAIDRLSLPSGAPLMPIFLEGFDDWVLGLWATEDGRLVIPSTESIQTFDVATGQAVNIAPAGSGFSFNGLFCWTNP